MTGQAAEPTVGALSEAFADAMKLFESVAGEYPVDVVEQYPLKGGLEINMVSQTKTLPEAPTSGSASHPVIL